jgi:uncharacterized protein (DUF58 family)
MLRHPRPSSAITPASTELLRQVRRVELRTRRLVNSRFSGEYLSSFKGQGIEFAEVREYYPGDDVRTIDWNVTARLGRPFVKRYVEERELSVLLVVDLSGSELWGSRGRLKSQLIAEVATTLAMSAVRNNDRVGLLIVTAEVELYLPPRKGRRHVLRLIRDLLAFQPANRGTDLAPAVTYAQRVLPHRSLIFFFSDFQLGDGWDTFGRSLALLRARHDVVACHLADPLEIDLPPAGLLRIVDPETGREVILDTSSSSFRKRFGGVTTDDADRSRRLFARLGVDEIRLRTDQPYNSALMNFFRKRERRLRR